MPVSASIFAPCCAVLTIPATTLAIANENASRAIRVANRAYCLKQPGAFLFPGQARETVSPPSSLTILAKLTSNPARATRRTALRSWHDQG
jgi:hypothetical protein